MTVRDLIKQLLDLPVSLDAGVLICINTPEAETTSEEFDIDTVAITTSGTYVSIEVTP